MPLYSMPHLSLTRTLLPVKLFMNGFGFNGTVGADIFFSSLALLSEIVCCVSKKIKQINKLDY